MRTYAVNGAGEIGRNVLRWNAMLEREGKEALCITHIAEEFLDRDQIAGNLAHDPVRGPLGVEVRAIGKDRIRIGADEIMIVRGGVKEMVDWGRLNVWGVLEATGQRVDGRKAAEHITEGGAQRVMITAPAKGEVPVKSLIVGFNEHEYDPQTDHVVENASCTTKSAVHVLCALKREAGLRGVFLTSVHAETGPERRSLIGRQAMVEHLGTYGFRQESTGAQKALEKLFPGVEVVAFSYRVPTPDGSVSEIVASVEHPRGRERVREVVRSAQRYRILQVLEGTVDNSAALIGNPHDAVVFEGNLRVQGHSIHISSGYDNAFAPAAAAVDLMAYMGKW